MAICFQSYFMLSPDYLCSFHVSDNAVGAQLQYLGFIITEGL